MDRVKLNFGATIITEHPFTDEAMEQLLVEARAMILAESKLLAKGDEPEDWDSEQNKAKYLKPVPKTANNSPERQRPPNNDNDDYTPPGLKRRGTKIANLVEAMMLNSVAGTSLIQNGEHDAEMVEKPLSPQTANTSTLVPYKELNNMTNLHSQKQTSMTCVIL